MTPASVPAPEQDNPHERLVATIREAITDPTSARDAIQALETLCADLEAATRERDAARAYAESQDWHTEWYAPMRRRAEVAERERDALAARLRDAPLGGNGSHWEGCWRSHIDCAAARVEAAERALEAARDALRFYANPITYEEMSPLDEWEGSLTGPIPIKDFDHCGDRARSALDASASTQTNTKL